MNNKYEDLDWMVLSAADRIEPTKLLYKALRAVSDITGREVDLLMDDAYGEPNTTSPHYASNFRRGNIAAGKAMMIHHWLEQNHFDTAQIASPALFQINPKSAWDSFVEAHAITGKLSVIPLIKRMGIAQRSSEARKSATTIRLGQDYCFELDSGFLGHCVAFECYQGQWHPLPLGADTRRLRTSVHQGLQLLPCDSKGDPIALVELSDGGEHQFVCVVSEDSTLPTDRQGLLKKKDDIDLHSVAVRFVT